MNLLLSIFSSKPFNVLILVMAPFFFSSQSRREGSVPVIENVAKLNSPPARDFLVLECPEPTETMTPDSCCIAEASRYIVPRLHLGGKFDALANAKFSTRNVSAALVVAKVKHPSLTKEQVFLPIVEVDISDKRNLVQKEIVAGVGLLENLMFRYDQLKSGYIQLHFYTVPKSELDTFRKKLNVIDEELQEQLARLYRTMNDEHSGFHSVTGIPADLYGLEPLMTEVYRSKNLLDAIVNAHHNKHLLMHHTQVFALAPMDLAIGSSVKECSMQITRQGTRVFIPELALPHLMIDLHMEAYYDIEGLPSGLGISAFCEDIPENILTHLAKLIDHDAGILTVEQRVLEADLLEMMKLFHKAKEGEIILDDAKDSYENFFKQFQQDIQRAGDCGQAELTKRFQPTAVKLRDCLYGLRDR